MAAKGRWREFGVRVGALVAEGLQVVKEQALTDSRRWAALEDL
jgi:hypothetical protein